MFRRAIKCVRGRIGLQEELNYKSFVEGHQGPKFFTQFNVYSNMVLPCRLVGEKQVEAYELNVKIKSRNFADTPKGRSLEGQVLTGKKLVFAGTANCRLVFKCPEEGYELCSILHKIPFSNYIVVPSEICNKDNVTMRHYVEDVTFCDITCGKMLISITLMVEYIDEVPEEILIFR